MAIWMLSRGEIKRAPTMMMKMMDMKEGNDDDEMHNNSMYNMQEMEAFY